jgi:hypothetical protein
MTSPLRVLKEVRPDFAAEKLPQGKVFSPSGGKLKKDQESTFIRLLVKVGIGWMETGWIHPDFITFYQPYNETLEGIHRYWLSVGKK